MSEKKTPTTIPRVPIQTPMFEDPSGARKWDWTPHRTWIIFWERIFKSTKQIEELTAGPFQRTLLLKDTTVGLSIADHTTVWTAGTAVRVTANLRKALTADLVVELWKLDITDVGAGFQQLISCTVPSSQGLDTPLDFTAFASDALKVMNNGDVLRWDVSASDGQTDRAGVAAFTFEWK